jgi:hypothetical protein
MTIASSHTELGQPLVVEELEPTGHSLQSSNLEILPEV